MDRREPPSIETFALTDDSTAVLHSERPVMMRRDPGVPAYVIFHDATLREIATRSPATLAELGTISGIGENKPAEYGQGVLDTLTTTEGQVDVPYEVRTTVAGRPDGYAERVTPVAGRPGCLRWAGRHRGGRMSTITGTAAGVPFTALPPAAPVDGPAPLIVTWHMLDAPRTDAAFASALPMTGVPAWRVHLGMPMCGARMVDGRVDAITALAREDALLSYAAPFVHQAADEFPAALAALRDRLPVDDEPIGILGGSLGGAVALQVLTSQQTPIRAAALVNPAVRMRTLVRIVEGLLGQTYPWTAVARATADALDFVARAAEITTWPPVLLVSGERDHPASQADAGELIDALHGRHPSAAELVTVPDLGHPLADEPGLEPAPQGPGAGAVDEILTEWFLRRFTRR